MSSGPEPRPAPQAAADQSTAAGGARQDHPAPEPRPIATAAESGTGGDSGPSNIHVININKIRERMGERWMRHADRVHSQIKAELKHRLTRHDYYSQVDADTYAIVFGDCSEAEARLKVALLSEHILEKLFGESEAKDIGVLGVGAAGAEGAAGSAASPSAAALAGLVDRAEVTQLDPGGPNYQDAAAGKRALTPKEVSELLGEVDTQLKAFEVPDGDAAPLDVRVDRLRDLVRHLESLERTIAAQDRMPTPEAPGMAAPDPGTWAEIKTSVENAVHQLKSRAQQQMAIVYDQSVPGVEGPSDADLPQDVDFNYIPMWHAPTQRVGIYLCQSSVVSPDQDEALASAAVSTQEIDLLAVTDRLSLRKVRKDLKQSYDDGRVSMLAVPIHFSTLQRLGNRRRVVELCSHIADDLRGLLIWEVLGTHYEAWESQLPPIIKPIRPFARSVFLRLHRAQDCFLEVRRRLRHLQTAGIHEVGLDVSTLEGTETEKLEFLEKLAVVANNEGLKCYAHGFESLSMTVCAVSLGYEHLSGPVIAQPMAEPGGIHGAAMEAIYSAVTNTEPDALT